MKTKTRKYLGIVFFSNVFFYGLALAPFLVQPSQRQQISLTRRSQSLSLWARVEEGIFLLGESRTP